jgi:hypothetical protein
MIDPDRTWTAADPLYVPDDTDETIALRPASGWRTVCDECGMEMLGRGRITHIGHDGLHGWVPEPAEDRRRSRDIALACIAGLVILALLAWVVSRG